MSNNLIGEKIRTFMSDRSVSVDELVQRSGLSAEAIQLIINDSKIPSLAPLIKISRALGVRPGTFLDDAEHLGPVVYRPADKQSSVAFSSQLTTSNSHLNFTAMAENKSGRHMEPFLITVSPVAGVGAQTSSHEGEEFIFVLKGSVNIQYGTEFYQLNAGESIYYDSIVNHLVSCGGAEAAEILAVIYTPI